jgi:hypothetical protein
MTLTKLNVFSSKGKNIADNKTDNNSPRKLEPEDLRQAFLRAAKEKWGNDHPIDVKKIVNGAIKVTVPSAPWRAAVLWARQEMVEKINAELGGEKIKKIVVWWE